MSGASARLRACAGWLLDAHGSTRPLGLFRILLVLLLWARLADELAVWNQETWAQAGLGVAFFLLTTMALIGWHTRRAMVLLAGVMVLVHFDPGLFAGHAPFQHHHVYLLMAATILCALGPCDRSFSLDRVLALRRGQARPEQGPLLVNRLLLLQLAAVYFWGAVDKTNAVFLSGVRLDQVLHFHYHESFLEPLVLWGPGVVAASVLVVVVEYFLAIAILLGRWPRVVLTLAVLLHGAFYILLPVQTFSLTMLAMYLFLVSPECVHRAVQQLVADGDRSAATASGSWK